MTIITVPAFLYIFRQWHDIDHRWPHLHVRTPHTSRIPFCSVENKRSFQKSSNENLQQAISYWSLLLLKNRLPAMNYQVCETDPWWVNQLCVSKLHHCNFSRSSRICWAVKMQLWFPLPEAIMTTQGVYSLVYRTIADSGRKPPVGPSWGRGRRLKIRTQKFKKYSDLSILSNKQLI